MLLASTNQAGAATLNETVAGLALVCGWPPARRVSSTKDSLRTQAADARAQSYSWVGNSSPVSYVITIKDYASATYSGFQTHLFLAPEAGMPNGPGLPLEHAQPGLRADRQQPGRHRLGPVHVQDEPAERELDDLEH